VAEVERNPIDTQTNALTIELGAKVAAMSRRPIRRSAGDL